MKILLSFLCLVSTIIIASANDPDWQTDYNTALAQAKIEKKQILLNFTGSDWCIWCMRLKKDVFDQAAFLKFAKNYLVLVDVDFPSSQKLSEKNKELKNKYEIQGFPTLILLDSNGKLLKKRTGYIAGGPEAVIKWIHHGQNDAH